jgi:hypothetical protein
LRPNPPTAPQKHQLEKQDQQPVAPGKGERKTTPGSAGGLQVCPSGVSAGIEASAARKSRRWGEQPRLNGADQMARRGGKPDRQKVVTRVRRLG